MDLLDSLVTAPEVTADSDTSLLESQTTDILQSPYIPKDGESVWMESSFGALAIVQLVFLIILCVFGTLINSLVFWIFNRRPALRSLSNRFVLSLVTANILISSITAPLILVETILKHVVYVPCLSEIISMISNSVIFAAIFSTLLIAVDRFYAVTSPLHYSMTITRSRSQVMIVIAWLCGALLSLPYTIICTIPFTSHLRHNLHITFTVVQILIGYAFPFLALCWLYVLMYNAAHRNSERTRKHSISGELLTVMDGTTSMIPQGIDFLTHYMNPFSKTPMAGSVPQPPNPSTNNNNNQNSVTAPAANTPAAAKDKKHRRRSSNGSASSLLFREEGRAIKTAFLVLASFLLCWSPHFSLILFSQVDSSNKDHHLPSKGWGKFFSLTGMLSSAILHPFIYVFRNKMACKEVSKLLCGFFHSASAKSYRKENAPLRRYESGSSRSGGSEYHQPSHNNDINNHDHYPLHQPPYVPSTKSPKRSSMKSLTPQSSLNSTITNVNSLGPDSPIILNSTGDRIHFGLHAGELGKPPFLRSLTLPEAPHPRVKFPPNLIRQKSYYPRTSSSSASSELTPALSRKSRFVRQDSICSINSNDSVLIICAEDGISDMGPPLSQSSNQSSRQPSSSHHHHPLQSDSHQNPMSRQDSNFSDTSHKTTDSGVVIDMVKISSSNAPGGAHHQPPPIPARAHASNPPAPHHCNPTTFRTSSGVPQSRTPGRHHHLPYLQTII